MWIKLCISLMAILIITAIPIYVFRGSIKDNLKQYSWFGYDVENRPMIFLPSENDADTYNIQKEGVPSIITREFRYPWQDSKTRYTYTPIFKGNNITFPAGTFIIDGAIMLGQANCVIRGTGNISNEEKLSNSED